MVRTSSPVAARRANPAVTQPRAVTPGSLRAQPDAPTNIAVTVDRIAAEHSLPPQLIHSVIRVESNYNPYAVSNKGALGIMQLIPETARRFGVKNAFDPEENIQGGAKYLRYLLDLFHGNYSLALAAYNAGEAAVTRYGGIPPYPETQNYVIEVGRRLDAARKTAAIPQASAPVVAQAKPEGPAHIVEVAMADGSVRYVTAE
jgi:soluble lytic murein transglycosylase-like protein